MGHLGMQKVKWLGRQGLFGSLGIKMSSESVQIPKCTACWLGGQQRRPVEGKTMKSHSEGILSANKLNPGDLIFLDQYV